MKDADHPGAAGEVGAGDAADARERAADLVVNNVLTVLNVLLKKAVEWNVIGRVPCVIRLLPIPKPSAGFYCVVLRS